MNNEFTSELIKTDPVFDRLTAVRCRLLVHVLTAETRVAAYDSGLERFTALAVWPHRGENGGNPPETVAEWLGFEFADGLTITGNGCYTLVPETLFEEKLKDTYLNFNHMNKNDCPSSVNNILNCETRLIYENSREQSLPAGIPAGFRDLHPVTVFLTNIMSFSLQQHSGTSVFLYLHPGCFDMAVTDYRRLLFCNRFTFGTAEDFIYFVLFAMQQLNLDAEKVPVLIAGHILKNSQIWDILYKYVRNAGFMPESKTVSQSHIFRNLPLHLYYLTTGMAVCES